MILFDHTFSEFPELRHVKSRTSPAQQVQAAKDLIRRLIKDRASSFDVIVDQSIGPEDRDTFQVKHISLLSYNLFKKISNK